MIRGSGGGPTTPIRAHRVGYLTRAAQSPAAPPGGIVGPNLPRAACKGRWPLFDDRIDGETPEARTARHEKAVTICWGCPELARCLAARLAEPELGAGVWGGQVFDSDRKCRCGQPIPTEAPPHQVHCTVTCHNTKRGRGTAIRAVNCKTCGTEFHTVIPHRRYCTAACRPSTPPPGLRKVPLPGLPRCQGCDTELTAEQTARGFRNCSTRCRKRASERRGRQREAA